VPVMALIIDCLLIARPIKHVIRSLWPWFLITVPFLIIARIVQPADMAPAVPVWQRPLIAADALAFYLGKIVWPVGLTIDYARTPQAVLRSGAIYWTWLIPAALAAAILIARKRWLTASALLFAAGLLPVLGLTTFLFQRFSTVADRFVYLSMLAVAFAAAKAVSLRWNRAVVLGCAIVLIVLAAESAVQVRTWRNRLSLYAHAVAVTPQSAGAHNNYGSALWRAGNADAARREFERALEIDPDFAPAKFHLESMRRPEPGRSLPPS